MSFLHSQRRQVDCIYHLSSLGKLVLIRLRFSAISILDLHSLLKSYVHLRKIMHSQDQPALFFQYHHDLLIKTHPPLAAPGTAHLDTPLSSAACL